MPSAPRRIQIDRPIDVVFDFFTHPAKDQKRGPDLDTAKALIEAH
ncbi:hypothetical protein [Glaciibacter psychrotolerans]|uniref:Uncharacterized protein n=1 Tax=Glaciibacter psychrotolerans TaxID=670054 RepID=A0A7Z0ED69_9MICO|nr:hypothetical protein [Leifsonia psychrotolerans]NYJ18854.1 hypothetical protein [Leifsonia psychrotolerans]